LAQLNFIHIVGAIIVPILNKRAALSLLPRSRGLALMSPVFHYLKLKIKRQNFG